MKLYFKIFIISLFLMTFCFSNVYAIDMFLSPANQNTNSDTIESATDESVAIDNNDEAETIEGTDEIEEVSIYKDETETVDEDQPEILTTGTYSQTSAPTVTTTFSRADNSLTTSDIINIILIAVCVVLILLAIAILIRCK